MKFLARKRTQKLLISLVLSLILVLISTQTNWLKQTTKTVQQNQPGLYSISHFIDGDTIAVNMNGTVETVRMIGIDTPETHKPNTPVQCYGQEAASFTKGLIGKQTVRLQADPLDTNRDRYGRLLRYVYLSDGRMVEKELLNNGYAFAYTLFPFQKKDEFADDMQAAKAAGRGLWSACHVHQETDGAYQTNPAS